VPGTNARLDEVQAAVLAAKLPHLDRWNDRRRIIAGRYTEAFAGLPGIVTPAVAPWAEPVWHQYVVRVPHRNRLREQLADAGVETLVHYPVATHRSPAYADAALGPGGLPRAERLADEVLSLPMGPHMSDETVDTVIDAVRAAVLQLVGERA
jgi:dTDP-3-amino-3,4,6-trideoxy-alpha-D-glucose transaminase